MTFTEAAVEVLRLVGKPLHYKKITEIAIDRNLLSHVGKTPEITMSSRLATMVKKDRGDAPIVKVKPGVFGLREFSDDVLKKAEKESGHDYELPPEEDTDEKRRPGATRAVDKSAADDSASDDGDEGSTDDAAKKKLPGQEVFAEEDDDDEPILANLDKKKSKGGRGGDDDSDDDDEDGRGRRKRRRRRRGKRGKDDDDNGGDKDDRRRGRRDDGRRDDSRRGGNKDEGRRGGNKDDRRRRGGSRRDKLAGDWDREPGEGEVLGHDLADAVREVLDAGKGTRPLDYRKLAELLVKKNKLSGSPEALVPTVAAAVRADGARRAMQGLRPRFREVGSEVELVEWALPKEAQRAEMDAMKSAARQRDLARRAFLRRVGELPMAGLAELLATWLNAEGVVQLRAIRRPSARGNAFHLAGVLKRGFEESRLAIVVYRDGTDLGREHVMEVRGALHHYDNASAAWLVTTGQVLSGAKDEASAAGREPCGLFDGSELARAMERVGVGLARHTIPVVALDLDLLDSLGRGETPARDTDRERDRQRKRREEREDKREEESKDEDESKGDDSDDDSDDDSNDDAGRRRRRRRGGRGRRGRDDESKDEDESKDDDSDDDQSKGDDESKGDDDSDDDESVVDTDEGPGSPDVTVDRADDDSDDDDSDDDSDDDDSDGESKDDDDSDDDTDDDDSDDDSDDDDSDDESKGDDDSDDDDSDDDDDTGRRRRRGRGRSDRKQKDEEE